MARYDVYSNPDGEGFLLDAQSDLLRYLKTRVVVPLLPLFDAHPDAKNLNPRLAVNGQTVIMATQFIATLPASHLKNPVCNIEENFAEITNALDFLFQGY